MKNIYFLLLILFLSNCNHENNDLRFENNVMNEIFITLVDSFELNELYKPVPPPPPPLPELFFKTDNQKTKDSILKNSKEQYEYIKTAFDKKVNNLNQIGEKIMTICITDSLAQLSKKIINSFQARVNEQFIYKEGVNPYKFNLDKFNDSTKYKFEYSSKLPNFKSNSDLWRWRENKRPEIRGIISFSRIVFNKKKNIGMLKGGISYGRHSGGGVIFIIEKFNNKWRIKEIFNTWVS
jgi:hypothetical protein